MKEEKLRRVWLLIGMATDDPTYIPKLKTAINKLNVNGREYREWTDKWRDIKRLHNIT